MSGTDGPALAGMADPTRPYRHPLAPKAEPGASARPLLHHQPTALDPAAASPPAAVSPPAIGAHARREEIEEAEEHAVRLFEEGRYSQAAGVLDELLGRARTHDPRLLETRRVHAAVLLAGGDYRRALAALQALVAAASQVGGPECEDIREYRQQIALCHAVLGEHEQALGTYRALLPGAEREEALGLQQKIADLLLALRRLREAIEVLRGLLNALDPASSQARHVRELLNRIELTGGNPVSVTPRRETGRPPTGQGLNRDRTCPVWLDVLRFSPRSAPWLGCRPGR